MGSRSSNLHQQSLLVLTIVWSASNWIIYPCSLVIFANHAPKNYKIGLPGRASVGGGGLAARPGPTLQGRKVATGKLGRKKMVQLGTATTSRARGVRVRGLLSSARRTSRLASWPGLGGPRFIENNQLFQFYNCPPGPACHQTHTPPLCCAFLNHFYW